MHVIRTLVASSSDIVRTGLRCLLAQQNDMLLVGEVQSVGESRALIRQQRPHVALIDFQWPGEELMALSRVIEAEQAPTRVLALIGEHDTPLLLAAPLAGIGGLVLKSSPPHELPAAIRSLVHNCAYLDPHMRKLALPDLQAGCTPAAGVPLVGLTRREHEILLLLGQGKSNKEIGIHLDIAENTVRNHVSRTLQKLKLHRRGDAALLLARLGPLLPEQAERLT